MSESNYTIDVFQESDAAGVAELFREVYGEGYPVKIVYRPDELVRAFRDAEYIPVLARTGDNRIVGYTALYRSAPHKGLYESGQTLVLPDYRKTPVAGLLFRRTMKIASRLPAVDALFCEAVCNHTHVQRAAMMFKHIETAIEIDLMPGEAYEREQSATGRVSTVDMFRTFVQKPHVVYVPEVYEKYFRFVYNGFDDGRTLIASTKDIPSSGLTEMATRIFDFAQLARITVHEISTDFEVQFDTAEKDAINKHCTVIQVMLKSSLPPIGEIINILRKRGFFLGGILPRWFGDDGFLMQKTIGRPNWEEISLYSDRSAQILHFIKDDWEEAWKL